MKIAIASGKGGAGKTTVTASLVSVWEQPCIAVDTDVEAPNLHLFLPPAILAQEQVNLEVPSLDPETCTSCGACRTICSYRAIAQFASRITIFSDLCHGCGGCFLVCPAQALKRSKRELGVLEEGTILNGRVRFLMGRTRIGEAMTPPLLRSLQRRAERMLDLIHGDALFDAPPGVSCPAMTVAEKMDAVLLVAEPTPFGFHDFRLAHQAFLPLGKPLAVIMNRSGMPANAAGDEAVRGYCREKGLPLLAELPFSRKAAEHYAQGGLLADVSPAWRQRFEQLRDAVRSFAGEATHA